MDMYKLAHSNVQERQQLVKGKKSKKSSRKAAQAALKKVVYISTPMKVTTSASKFREIVQELTGRESDVVRIMDSCGGHDSWMVPDDQHHDHHDVDVNSKGSVTTTTERSSSSTTSSDELVEPFDGIFLRGHEGVFGPSDHSSLLFDQFCQQVDVLGTY